MKITEMKEVLNLGAFINDKLYYIEFKSDPAAHEGIYYCDNIDWETDTVILKRLVNLRGCDSFNYMRFELSICSLSEVFRIEPLSINVEYDSSLLSWFISTNIEAR